MNDASCDSSSAGFRPERARRAAAVAALLACALAGCARKPVTAADLRMPPERAGFASVEDRRVLTDDGKADAGDRAIGQMRRARIASAAEYVYLPAPPATAAIKVKVELFVDEAAALANWQVRHRPEALAMTRPLDAGDQAWAWKDQMAGVRVGRAIFEFRGRGAGAAVPDFARAYAGFAGEILGS